MFTSHAIYKVDNGLYFDNSYLPVEEWSPTSINLSYTDSSADYQQKVTVLDIPKDILELFHQLQLDQYQSDDKDFLTLIKKDNEAVFNTLSQKLNAWFKTITFRDQKKIIGLFSLEGNKWSTAYDAASDKYIGLHIDNSLGLPYEDHEFKPNRMSLNLGTEPRYFMYSTLHIKDILEKATEERVTLKDNFQLMNFYYQHFKEEPIYQIEIQPGEAYIAPSDHVIHDGRNLHMKSKDITFVVAGYFKV
jgi:hypothetical protein